MEAAKVRRPGPLQRTEKRLRRRRQRSRARLRRSPHETSLSDDAPGRGPGETLSASIANAVQQMMLAAASMNLGTVWVSVREEVEPELRKLFQVPPELRLLWVGSAQRVRTLDS